MLKEKKTQGGGLHQQEQKGGLTLRQARDNVLDRLIRAKIQAARLSGIPGEVLSEQAEHVVLLQFGAIGGNKHESLVHLLCLCQPPLTCYNLRHLLPELSEQGRERARLAHNDWSAASAGIYSCADHPFLHSVSH
jgi:hypothetical protein